MCTYLLYYYTYLPILLAYVRAISLYRKSVKISNSSHPEPVHLEIETRRGLNDHLPIDICYDNHREAPMV